MTFSVLGPLEVRLAGADVTPKAPMVAHLLTLLLLHANEIVSLNTIVDELWDAPPRLAKKTVQTYIYQLRKQIGALNPATRAELIETHARGYRIRILDTQLDLRRFDRLVGEGNRELCQAENATASAAFRQALELWRGPLAAGLDAGPDLNAEVAALEDRRLEALERRIEADLCLGRQRSLIGELKGLVARYSTHEGFCALLMAAAQRVGRRDEALDAYQRLRRSMIGELGIDPSDRLQELYQKALSSRPGAVPSAVEVIARRPAQLPFDNPDFVGRASELRELVELAVGDDRPASTVLAVVGQPGTGKTTLAVHAAHRCRSSFPDGQLYATLHDQDSRPVRAEQVLASFLRALGVPDSALPAELDERASLFRTVIAGRKVLVLLDDAASVDQVLPLLPAGSGSAAFISSLRRLPGLPGLRTVELGPLTLNEGCQLLATVIGAERVRAEPRASQKLVALCDQLPLAIRAAGERLAASPGWPVSTLVDRLTLEDRRLAELRSGAFDIRHSFDRAVERLSASDRNTLTVLCGLDGSGWFDLSTVASTIGVEPVDAELLICSLVSTNLLQASRYDGPAGEPRYRFSDLIRLHVRRR